MPTIETFLLFAGTCVLLTLVPGPSMLFIATRSISQGTRAGFVSALGVATGTLVHILAASVGLSALIAASSVAFDIIRYAGAAYLVYLGIRTLIAKTPQLTTSGAARLPLKRLFASGVIVNVLNVKVALFFLALLPQFVDPARGNAAPQMLVLGFVVLVIGLSFDMIWAMGAGSLNRVLIRRPRIWTRQKYVVGPIYIGMGVAAAVSGVRAK